MAEAERILMDSGCCRFIVTVDDEDTVTDSEGEESPKILAVKYEAADGHKLNGSVRKLTGDAQRSEALGRVEKRVDIPVADRFHLLDFEWHCKHEVG